MAAVLALGNTSCSDFLEVKPAGSVSEQDFVSAKGVEQLVTGMYAKMHDNSYFEATLSNYVYGDVRAVVPIRAPRIKTNRTSQVWRPIRLPQTTVT